MSKRGRNGNGRSGRPRTRRANIYNIGKPGYGGNYPPRKFVAGRDRTSGFYGKFRGNGELKYHDIDVDDPVIAAGAVVQNTGSVNLIPQGTTEITRIGRKCTIMKIGWRYRLTIPTTATAANTSDVVRILLYVDKQCNGATAVNTDILKTADFQSFNNLANSQRFRILMDRTYALRCPSGSGRGATDTLSYGNNVIVGKFFKKCNIPLEFDDVNGALTEIRSNNIGVLICCAFGHSGFASKMRLRFTDN